MAILVKDTKTGRNLTFDAEWMVKALDKKGERYEIIKKEHPIGSPNIKDIPYKVLQPDQKWENEFDTTSVKVSDFTEMLTYYEKTELEAFAKDDRKTVSSKAKKELSKRFK